MSTTKFTDLKKGFKIDILFQNNPSSRPDYEGTIQRLEKIQSKNSKGFLSMYLPYIHEGFKIAIQLIYRYLNFEVIREYFPGLSLVSIDNYDFSKAKIRIYVFSLEDMDIFYKEFNFAPDTSGTALILRNFKSKAYVGMPIIIIKERVLERNPSLTFDKKKLMVQKDIVHVTTHETLHILGLSQFHLPSTNMLLEPLVELLAIKGVSSIPRYADIPEVKEHLVVGYPNMTYGLNLLINKLKKNGLRFDDFICGYGFGDKKSLDKINNKIIELFGEQAYLELNQIIKNKPSSFNYFIKKLLRL